MAIAPDHARAIVRGAFSGGTLTVDEAEAIVALGQLAVDADGYEDKDEIALFFAFGKAIYELTGMKDLPTPTFLGEDDDDRIAELVGQLTSDGARALAYATAYALAGADDVFAAAEDVYVERLRAALGLSDARARQIAAAIT